MKLSRFTLRDLFWLVLGVGVIASLGVWASRSFETALGVLILGFALIATWLSFYPERRFHQEVAGREELSDKQFYSLYYATSGIPPETCSQLRDLCQLLQTQSWKAPSG